jgi:galactonate dehydratase
MANISRRRFLNTAIAATVAGATLARRAEAELRKMKITRIRFYESPITRPMVNQSFHVVTIETDAGITGIGEGGSKDFIDQCAAQLIGKDPTRIQELWQLMFRGFFYPAGREKIHALGALDLALWDLKGKALGVPVWELIGGLTRDHVECYSTGFPKAGDARATAKACVDFGFRAIRTSVSDAVDGAFVSQQAVRRTLEHCQELRAGVGRDGDWAIDFHTRLDFPDAVRLCTLIEPLEPYFVEDLVRSENNSVYRQLRPMVKVPIAVGEQHSTRWEINELIENRLIDYCRISIPNCGGLTEYLKLAALCETHYVGLTPHFTGTISEAALVHACSSFSGPVLMEMTGNGVKDIPYLPKHYDFKGGKMYPNNRPGLGIDFDSSKVKMLSEITTHAQPITVFRRKDGSFTNW